MRVGLARPAGRDPGGRAVELEHLRGRARRAAVPPRIDRRRGRDLRGPDRDELERAVAIGVAVARFVRLVEPLGETRAERRP